MTERVLLPKDLGADADEIYLVFYWARRARRSRNGVVYRDAEVEPHASRGTR